MIAPIEERFYDTDFAHRAWVNHTTNADTGAPELELGIDWGADAQAIRLTPATVTMLRRALARFESAVKRGDIRP